MSKLPVLQINGGSNPVPVRKGSAIRRSSTSGDAYPGTEVAKAPFGTRDWAVKDPGYIPGEYTAPAIAEGNDVDPTAVTYVTTSCVQPSTVTPPSAASARSSPSGTRSTTPWAWLLTGAVCWASTRS